MEKGGHANQEVTFLNIHQRITALDAGRLDPNSSRDTLLIGTPTNLLAYDIEAAIFLEVRIRNSKEVHFAFQSLSFFLFL